MAGKNMKPGGGGRFAKMVNELSGKPGIYDPAGLAASIGAKKYGKKRMAQFAAKGRAK